MTTAQDDGPDGPDPRPAAALSDPASARARDGGSQFRGFLAAYQRRGLRNFVLSAGIGTCVGLTLAAYAWIVEIGLFQTILRSDTWWVYLILPAVGLTLAAVVVRYLVPSRRPDTSEAYVEAYHADADELRLRDLPGRMLASVVTIGLGGSMGLEGPAVYLGATSGAVVQRRFHRWFGPQDVKVLMVAGAAAGIAAVFKAPLTGVLFALEAPYTEDLVRRALIPSLVSASTSYLAFTAIAGPARLFQFASVRAETTYFDLLLAIGLGVLCAVAARLFVHALAFARRAVGLLPGWSRPTAAGLAVGGFGVASYFLVGNPVILGPGIDGTREVVALDVSLGVLLALFALKVLATAFTSSGGGVGGLFFPLVFMGATIGQAFGGVVTPTARLVFPMVGIAAMVGAGFRSPLAAVAFVAETTGQPAFIIPALLAAAFAQSLMGSRSVSRAQLPHRMVGLERVLRTRCRDVCTHPVPVVDAGMGLEAFARAHVLTTRQQAVPVRDGAAVVGLMPLGRLATVDHGTWSDITVGEVMERDPVVVDAGATLGSAVESMVRRGSDFAVVTDDGGVYGLLAAADIVGLDDVLNMYGRHTGSS